MSGGETPALIDEERGEGAGGQQRGLQDRQALREDMYDKFNTALLEQTD